jgi:hypothetical protein
MFLSSVEALFEKKYQHKNPYDYDYCLSISSFSPLLEPPISVDAWCQTKLNFLVLSLQIVYNKKNNNNGKIEEKKNYKFKSHWTRQKYKDLENHFLFALIGIIFVFSLLCCDFRFVYAEGLVFAKEQNRSRTVLEFDVQRALLDWEISLSWLSHCKRHAKERWRNRRESCETWRPKLEGDTTRFGFCARTEKAFCLWLNAICLENRGRLWVEDRGKLE